MFKKILFFLPVLLLLIGAGYPVVHIECAADDSGNNGYWLIVGVCLIFYAASAFLLGRMFSLIRQPYPVFRQNVFDFFTGQHRDAPPFSKPYHRFFQRLLLFILFGMAALLVWPVLQDYREAKTTADWIPAVGTVLSAHVDSSIDSDACVPHIRYRYSLNGTIFHSTMITASPFRADRATAEAWIKSHAPDSPITLYYNPAAPEKSVLERGYTLHPADIIALFFAGCFAFGGLLFLFSLLIAFRSEKEKKDLFDKNFEKK